MDSGGPIAIHKVVVVTIMIQELYEVRPMAVKDSNA